MNNSQRLQGILSIAALAALAVGWFDVFSPEISSLIYGRLFYVLIGCSFVLQGQALTNKKFVYPLYVAAGFCIIGAFLPFDSELVAVKTVGLFAGVIISMFNRPRIQRGE